MAQPQIFVSYSHKDREWLTRLQAHLGVLQQEGLVAAWSDETLQPGDDWPQEIRTALDSADIAVLLLSANFLNSKFIMEKEMPVLLKRKQDGKLRKILPLVVTPCSWGLSRHLKDIEVRPKARDSVVRGSEAEQEADLRDLTTEIAKLLSTPKVPSGPAPEPGGTGPAPEHAGGQQAPSYQLPEDPHYAILELAVAHREWDRYTVDLSLTHSGGAESCRPLTHVAAFDLPKLLAIEDPAEHARQLHSLLFPEQPQRDLICAAAAAARTLGVPLRLRIAVDACARELHCLRWELLTLGARAENPLSFESTYLLRYAGADPRHWRNLQHRPKAPFTAVAAPGLTDWFDSSIPPSGAADPAVVELASAREMLKSCGIETAKVLGYLNSEAFALEVRAAASDVLYLCVDLPPGNASAESASAGLSQWFSGLHDLPLAEALTGLETPPRLVVLSPIVRGADGSPQTAVSGWLSLLREAYELAQTGVAGVLTLQGPLDGAAWHTFLGAFFRRLAVDGRMDLALHVARAAIGPELQWVPVLISGLRSARVWYVPRFTDEAKAEPAWQTLLSKIAKGLCTPILGPGLNSTVARSRTEIALSWADSYRYPMAFHERVSLPQVAQYVASVCGEDFLYEKYEARLREFVLDRFGTFLNTEERALEISRLVSKVAQIILAKDPNEPHNILASLPFPLYVTASQNSFLSDALRGVAKRQPLEAALGLADATGSTVDSLEPSAQQPLVYHLFGTFADLRNSVITEDNYFDFLIHFWKDLEAVPRVVRAALTNSSLLFMGFKMDHWDFRVLFRSLLAQEGSRRRTRHMHVAVQVDPDDDQIVDPERARGYIEGYFSKFADAEINVYWGSAQDFLLELKKRWNGRLG